MKGKDYKTFILVWQSCIGGQLVFCCSVASGLHGNLYRPCFIFISALFSVFHPVSLFSNLFFVVFWLLGRRKYFLISFVAILIGFSHLSHFVQFSFIGHGIESKEKELNVMSYNVRLFDLYNWTQNKYTRNEIFKFLEEEDPDIICFQEFYHQHPFKT